MNWRRHDYLQSGTVRQQRAYDTLTTLGLFKTLHPFDPALVSTVCVRLDIEGSDLDVICELKHPAAFKATVQAAYGARGGFQMRSGPGGALVVQFDTEAFPVEIFAKRRPVEEQYAWRHLSVMKRLLNIVPALRPRVRTLKREGHATEEAFAELLRLDGDPFEAFLALEDATQRQLAERCRRAL